MSAVLGLDASIIEETIAKLNPPNNVWAANFNTKDQTVISGSVEGVETASAALMEIGARKIVPLQVHGAFHSGLMIEAQEKLKPEIENANIVESPINLVMNVCGNYISSVEEIKKYLILQVTNGVRWKQGIQNMEENSINCYLEIGPSKTLTMMNKKNKVPGISINVGKISDLDKISNELGL
jgi:[acyl-carrier-protein] S-malonyltransferase